MKTEKHWREATEVEAYHAAHRVALGMIEHAKTTGVDYSGIRVLDKKNAHYDGLRHVDSVIKWEDGPAGWAYLTDVILENVHVEPIDGHTLTFYQR